MISPEEENERLQSEGFAEKEGFKSGMKERMGDGKLIIISMSVSGKNDHMRLITDNQVTQVTTSESLTCLRRQRKRN